MILVSTGSPVQKVSCFKSQDLVFIRIKERIFCNCILERNGFRWGLVRRKKYFRGENYPRTESRNVERES